MNELELTRRAEAEYKAACVREEKKEYLRQNPPAPFNQALHDFLITNGYQRYHEPESFEDDGDCENGPHLTGDPAFDEYVDENTRVIVEEGGVVWSERCYVPMLSMDERSDFIIS